MEKRSKGNVDSPTLVVDRISNLPDSILLEILSLLPFKSIATTSVLSKRWTNLFQHFLIHTDCLDFGQVFARPQRQQQFIDTVNRYLKLHNRDEIQKFRLLFYPNLDYQVHADKWLEFAIQRSVKELDFDFCGTAAFDDDQHDLRCLELPDLLYSSNSPLTHLKLGQFYFDPPLAFTGFASLVSLCLRRVNITEDTLESVLMKCPLLTVLSLCECHSLKYIRILGAKEFPLERLFVGNCYQEEALTIDVWAPNLKSFHFFGYLSYDSLFLEAPALEDVYLISTKFPCNILEDDYIHILSCVHYITILTVGTGALEVITSAVDDSSEDLPVHLPNLQELQILLEEPLDEDCLSYFYGFFKNTICPCLEKLFIELFADRYHMQQSDQKERVAEELASTCSFDNLKIVKITNFCGSKTEMRLVKSFLSKSVSLELMMLVAAKNSEMEKQIAHVKNSGTSTVLDELLILPKASNDARVVLCGDWEADSRNLRHKHAKSAGALQHVEIVDGWPRMKSDI
ncbi:hypothetical protein Sjap_025529 [Stephania japonica]|uniref:F-box domain-containing protein n=1 Tax=Stephania japonica TaxID=461633 RepID=A0AAP0E9M5_9MAGN